MSEKNKVAVRRVQEEVFSQGGNLDAVEEVYAPDYVGHAPPYGDIRGTEDAKQSAATDRQAFPDLQTTIEDMVAEGDKVVTRWTMRGTHQGETEGLGPATGKRIEITGIGMYKLTDEGKIAEFWDHFDALGMMQQLGLIPKPVEQATS
jgi:steroid delta-isomerase-like uncharacterized protein